MRRLLAGLVSGLIASLVVAAPAPAGRIQRASGELLTPAQLVSALADVDLVLVGETHDNVAHHAVEAWLAKALAERRTPGAVVMEMLAAPQQAAVTSVQRFAPADRRAWDDAALARALVWQPGWPWALYAPLMRQLLDLPGPIVAGDLGPDALLRLRQPVPPLEGASSTAEPVRERLRQEIARSHCRMLSAEQVERMLTVQQHRDRHLATQVLAAPAPVLLIAGRFHASRLTGVPLHVADLAPERRQRVLLLAVKGETVPSGSADFIWFVPATAADAKDPCAAMTAGARP